jgi:hypothetical protein
VEEEAIMALPHKSKKKKEKDGVGLNKTSA